MVAPNGKRQRILKTQRRSPSKRPFLPLRVGQGPWFRSQQRRISSTSTVLAEFQCWFQVQPTMASFLARIRIARFARVKFAPRNHRVTFGQRHRLPIALASDLRPSYLSPVLIYDFLSRCKVSTLTPCNFLLRSLSFRY